MKTTLLRLLARLLAVVALALFLRTAYLVLSAPPDPAFMAANHDAVIAQSGHMFRQAAYSMTWAIQLGYLAWVGMKWSRSRPS